MAFGDEEGIISLEVASLAFPLSCETPLPWVLGAEGEEGESVEQASSFSTDIGVLSFEVGFCMPGGGIGLGGVSSGRLMAGSSGGGRHLLLDTEKSRFLVQFMWLSTIIEMRFEIHLFWLYNPVCDIRLVEATAVSTITCLIGRRATGYDIGNSDALFPDATQGRFQRLSGTCSSSLTKREQ